MKTTKKKTRVIYTLKNQNLSHHADYFANEIDLSVLILFVIGEYDEELVAPLDRRGSPKGEVTSLNAHDSVITISGKDASRDARFHLNQLANTNLLL